jgi:hypothetical protein
VGTDDGVIQRTRDGGTTWTNITPAAWGDGLVNEIAVSPFDAGTIYVSFRKDRLGDYAPHVYVSRDYGATFTEMVTGLRANEPVRVVREDPARKGLLYAGTETGVYVSYDGGAWMPFTGFPVTPVTDLAVKHGDLIASTEGRSFWILDDLSVLRQRADSLAKAAIHLYAPRPAVLLASGTGPAGRGTGANPAFGATVSFRLAAAPDSVTTVSVEFLDAKGAVVRAFATKDSANRLTAKAGLNSVYWNLRRAAPARLGSVLLFGAPNDGGARVTPGAYTVRLTFTQGSATTVLTRPLEVRQDPRITTPVGWWPSVTRWRICYRRA